MIRTIKQGELRMTLPTNEDFANRELSIEELDAIAAGSIWGWIKHEAGVVVHEIGSAVHWIETHVKVEYPFPKYPFPGPGQGKL
jgi:hypothetical protein